MIAFNGFSWGHDYSYCISGEPTRDEWRKIGVRTILPTLMTNSIIIAQSSHNKDRLHLSFQLLFFGGGIVFFVKQLFKNYEIKHFSIQLIFSTTFALSLTLFELIIFEIIGFLESSSRFFHWRVTLVAILVLVIAIIPYKIAHSLISNIRISM